MGHYGEFGVVSEDSGNGWPGSNYRDGDGRGCRRREGIEERQTSVCHEPASLPEKAPNVQVAPSTDTDNENLRNSRFRPVFLSLQTTELVRPFCSQAFFRRGRFLGYRFLGPDSKILRFICNYRFALFTSDA